MVCFIIYTTLWLSYGKHISIVTRPFCLVESHIVKTLLKAGVLCFTSYTFCNNNGSCSLRLNERIYICIHLFVFYLLELAVMINLHKWCQATVAWCDYSLKLLWPIISEGRAIEPCRQLFLLQSERPWRSKHEKRIGNETKMDLISSS